MSSRTRRPLRGRLRRTPWRPRSRRAAVSLGLVLAVGGVASVALADIVAPANAGHLTAVGPVSASNGFPTWYKDDAGTRLEPCLDPLNSLCGALADETPDPSAPVSFPDNFPAEVFYMSAGTDQALAGGGRAVSTFSLEGAFANDNPAPGDQITFGRVRFFYKGLKAGATYTITHPYGKDKIVAEQDPGAAAGVGRIRYTQDVEPVRGQFGGALNSRIGPFLKWDPNAAPAAPAGYVGDPDVDHAIVGSPYGTNFVRIEGPGLAATAADRCSPTPAGANPDDCIQTSLFSLQGKYASNGGVDVDRVAYSRDDADGGTIDVFASSDLDPQSIQVSGDGFDPTRLTGDNGHYQARVHYTGDEPPLSVKVANVGDVPVAEKTVPVDDKVYGTAVYDLDAHRLTVDASSADTLGRPRLTAKGYGPLPDDGVLVADVNGAPANVTVTSAAGGSITVPVSLTGGAYAAIPVQAFAGPDQEVLSDKKVTLEGTGSTGPVKSYQWQQTSGPSVDLTGATTATPSFTAPTVDPDATLAFELTVTGSGGPSTSTVKVHVLKSAPAPVANAGADQTVAEDGVVTLDASTSQNATAFAWKQTGGPSVALTGANTAKPTFRFPKQNVVLTFSVTVTGASGSATDEVKISTTPDTLRTTLVQYTRSKGQWRVTGTSSLKGPGVTVTLHNGATNAGPVIGTPAVVDTLGNWEVRVDSPVNPVPSRASVQSSAGGALTNLVVSVK
jgi:hypothetical protein